MPEDPVAGMKNRGRFMGEVGPAGKLLPAGEWRSYLHSALRTSLRMASGREVLCEEDSKLRVNQSISGFCDLRAQQVMNGSQLEPPQSADVVQTKPQLHRQNPVLLKPAATLSARGASVSDWGRRSGNMLLIEWSGIR